MLKLSLEFCETDRFSAISLSFIQIQQKTYNIVCHYLLKAINTIKIVAEFSLLLMGKGSFREIVQLQLYSCKKKEIDRLILIHIIFGRHIQRLKRNIKKSIKTLLISAIPGYFSKFYHCFLILVSNNVMFRHILLR